ncbi:MAG: hypothetical protein V3V67_09330 [Myxococcota bacterium]
MSELPNAFEGERVSSSAPSASSRPTLATGTFRYGLGIFREARRRGYTSEAIRLLLRFSAFLRVHQSHSHALPFALLAGGLLWLAIHWLDWRAPWAPLALTLGMVTHSWARNADR